MSHRSTNGDAFIAVPENDLHSCRASPKMCRLPQRLHCCGAPSWDGRQRLSHLLAAAVHSAIADTTLHSTTPMLRQLQIIQTLYLPFDMWKLRALAFSTSGFSRSCGWSYLASTIPCRNLVLIQSCCGSGTSVPCYEAFYSTTRWRSIFCGPSWIVAPQYPIEISVGRCQLRFFLGHVLRQGSKGSALSATRPWVPTNSHDPPYYSESRVDSFTRTTCANSGTISDDFQGSQCHS
ncbi:hypothetical protein B0H14DRAFT_1588028 [Mycena olivaceomarginata]|nr:hypothetical protein B0H14DRAFT_1588028 [Mycena olivaceomarginata]